MSAVGAMGVGLCLPQLGGTAHGGEVARVAARAEQLGYDSLWVGDRLLTPRQPQDLYPVGGTPEHPYPDEFTRALDPIVTLSAAAAVTERVRLAMSTLNAPWYNAVILGRALTSLDVVSAGRVDCGFGVSWMRDEYEAAGVPWDERGARLDETLDVLHALWTENPVEHHGAHFTIARSTVDLRPVQPGGPPILLGGFSPVALRRVGRRADGWLGFLGAPEEYVSTLWETAREAAREAGRDPDALRREMRLNVAPGEDSPRGLREMCLRAREDGIDGVHVDFSYVSKTATDLLAHAEALAAALELAPTLP